MHDRLKKLAERAKEAVASATVVVGDLNGDGVVDEKDAQIAAEWARAKANSAADEAARLGKTAIRSEMAKDAAAGAASGAVIAIPVPVIGPVAGAVVGAGLGVYKNLTKKGEQPQKPPMLQAPDLHGQLLKLADLRDKGILTEAEFEAQKRKVLSSDN